MRLPAIIPIWMLVIPVDTLLGVPVTTTLSVMKKKKAVTASLHNTFAI